MTRKIIFRAKRSDTGEWVYGDLTHVLRVTVEKDVPCIRVAGYDVDEDTIGQFTGLTDKEGKEIWEGDILEYRGWERGEVYWNDYVAGLKFNREYEVTLFGGDSAFMKVVGNKFDNPELLEEEQQ